MTEPTSGLAVVDGTGLARRKRACVRSEGLKVPFNAGDVGRSTDSESRL
jgi:hypothetical protein